MSWEQPARRATDGAGQVIEVLWQHDWWPAVLLGCRLEPDGRPLAHVRLDADPPRLLWLPFTQLRLPPAAPPGRCLLGPTAEAGRHRARTTPARQPGRRRHRPPLGRRGMGGPGAVRICW